MRPSAPFRRHARSMDASDHQTSHAIRSPVSRQQSKAGSSESLNFTVRYFNHTGPQVCSRKSRHIVHVSRSFRNRPPPKHSRWFQNRNWLPLDENIPGGKKGAGLIDSGRPRPESKTRPGGRPKRSAQNETCDFSCVSAAQSHQFESARIVTQLHTDNGSR